MLPPGTVFVRRKSRLENRTWPVAFVSSTRFPVAGNVSVTVTSSGTSRPGTTSAAASGSVAAGSALIVQGQRLAAPRAAA